MKIPENLPGSGIGGAGLGGANGAERTGGAGGVTHGGGSRTGETSSDGDRVDLSNLSQTLRVTSEDTPERVAKVEKLREDNKAGKYQPDATKVSQKIVDEAIHGPLGGQG